MYVYIYAILPCMMNFVFPWFFFKLFIRIQYFLDNGHRNDESNTERKIAINLCFKEFHTLDPMEIVCEIHIEST